LLTSTTFLITILVSIASASKLSLFFERSFLARGLKNIIAKTEIAVKKVISTFRLSNAKETNIVIAAAKANQTVTRAGIINSITVKIIVSINQNT